MGFQGRSTGCRLGFGEGHWERQLCKYAKCNCTSCAAASAHKQRSGSHQHLWDHIMFFAAGPQDQDEDKSANLSLVCEYVADPGESLRAGGWRLPSLEIGPVRAESFIKGKVQSGPPQAEDKLQWVERHWQKRPRLRRECLDLWICVWIFSWPGAALSSPHNHIKLPQNEIFQFYFERWTCGHWPVWLQTGHLDKDAELKVWKFKSQHPEKWRARKTPGRAWRMVWEEGEWSEWKRGLRWIVEDSAT